MASKVEICNSALQRVGATRITALTDGTEEAVSCNTIYDIIADEVMSSGAFSSTVRRVALAQTATTPVYEFTYEYQLPVDPKCLKVLSIDGATPSSIPYAVEGDKLLTDETTVNIKYVTRLSSTESYGPYLTKAIISRLASELAYRFAGTQSLKDSLMAQYQLDLATALAEDSLQGVSDPMYIGTLIEDR